MKRAIFYCGGGLMISAFLLGCSEQGSRPENSQTTGTTTPNQEATSRLGGEQDGPRAVTAALDELRRTRTQAASQVPQTPLAPANAESRTIPGQPSEELLRRARAGEAIYQRDLGKFYSNHGDQQKSAEWYREAAEQGDAEAQRMLGIAYIYGHGVERNMEEAGKWFLLSAEQGDVIAQRELGKIYGDQWKYTESNDWYLRAALQGDAESQRILGLRFTIGQGVESNREEARRWFEMAANQGDAIAQRELGKYYGEKWDLAQSNAWYLKAAQQGDIRAQHMMGVRYTFGQGVERNIDEAGKWFLLAAEQGDAQSQFSLGLRWARGEAGEPQDFAEAAKWFQLAADQGLDDAQLSLGRRYANGEGVSQDYVEAYKWVQLAQDQGKVTGAGKILNELTAKMTPEQIAEAQAKAKAFTPKGSVPLQ